MDIYILELALITEEVELLLFQTLKKLVIQLSTIRKSIFQL